MGTERRCIRVVSAEIQREGQFLITRRPDHAVLPGLWEFPGGRVQEEEADAAALLRALKQRIQCSAAVGDKVMEVRHPYDGYDVILVVYRCELTDAEPVCGSVAELAWVYPEQLTGYAFPGADQQTVDLLIGAME